ncbi:hypothetical protein M5689_016834 [Euphorbia peplus]|nr:hypothetical protein M5689_016834 [Euphorbia peplus]
MSNKLTSFFLLSLVLSFIIFAHVHAARPSSFLKETAENGKDDDATISSCNGGADEECLRRKTQEAHIDYIYTQNHGT